MRSYKDNDPIGWCGDRTRGAAHGRTSIHADDKSQVFKFQLRKIRLNSGGYDCNGTYFGGVDGLSLYWYASDRPIIVDATICAKDRKTAKEEIRKIYPKAKFYR